MEKYNNNKDFLKLKEVNPEFYLLSGDYYYSLSNFTLALCEYKKAEDISPRNPDYKYRIGKTLLQIENIREAHNYFEKALNLEPDRAEFHNALSYTFHCLGKLEEARKHSERATEISPEIPLFRHNSAVIHMEILIQKKDITPENLDVIAMEYRKGGINNPDMDRDKISGNFSALGLLYFTTGYIEKARIWFLKALELTPEKGELYVNLATLNLLEGNYEEAVRKFKRALEIKKYPHSVHRGLALCYEKLSNINMAIMEYEKLLKLNSHDEFARNRLNEIYDSIRMKNMSNSFINLSRIYMEDGEVEKASYELQNAIKMGGETFEIIIELNRVGLYLLIKGKDTEALRMYEKSATLLKKLYGSPGDRYYKKSLSPENILSIHKVDIEKIICYRMLRNIYYNKQLYTTSEYWHNELLKSIGNVSLNLNYYDYSGLDRLIYEIEEAVKTSSNPCPEFYRVMGDIGFYKSDFEVALSNYKKAMQLSPEDTSYMLLLARCLVKSQKYREASLEYRKVLFLDPSLLPEHRNNLRHLFGFLEEEDFKLFEMQCFEKIKSAPHEPCSYFVLGELYLQRNRLTEAIKAYECALRLDFSRKLFLHSLRKACGLKGEKMYKEDNLLEAEKMLSLACPLSDDKDTDIYRYYLTLGLIYYRWKDFEKSSGFFLKLRYSNSELRIKAYKYLGVIYEIQKNLKKAEYYNREFLEEMSIKARDQLIMTKNSTFFRIWEENLHEDSEEYERAIELAPEKAIYYEGIVNLYDINGKLDFLSKRFFEKISSVPEFSRIFLHTGKVYYEKDLPEKAEEEYNKAFNSGLKSEELARALAELALKFFDNSKLDKAIDNLKKAIKCCKNYSEASYNLGIIYCCLENFPCAIEYLQQAVLLEKNEANKAKFLSALGRVYLKIDKIALASEHFKKVIDISPGSADAFYSMAIIDYRAGIPEEAVNNFLKVLEIDPCHLKTIKSLRDIYKEDLITGKHWQEQLNRLLKIKMLEKDFLKNIIFSEELEDIMTEYENAFGLKGKDIKYLQRLAELYKREKKLDKASKVIEKCTALNPELAYLHVELSNAYIETKKIEAAKIEALKALECGIKTLDFSSVCIKIGNQFLQRKEMEKAQIEYEHAWDMGNRSKELALKFNKIGVEYSSTGNIDGSIEQFKKSIEIIPDNFIFHKNLATMYHRKGLLEEAIRSFEKAEAIKPEDIKILEKLREVYQEAGYFKSAIKILKKLLEIKPSTPVYIYFMAKIYYEMGKYKKAITCYKESISLKPDRGEAYTGLAFTYIEQNDLIQARENFEKALKFITENKKALVGLAYVCKVLDEPQLAAKYYNEAMDIYLEEIQKKDVSSSVFIELGDLFLYKMDIDTSIEKYKQALNIKEKNIKATMRLGKALFIKGELSDSEIELKKLINNNVEFPEAYFYLGDICLIKRQIKESIDYYRDVIRLNPDWLYKAYERLSRIYLEINEKPLSLKCYSKGLKLKENKELLETSSLSSMDINKVIELIEKDLRERDLN